MKEARRAEVQQRIAAAKTRLLVVQQRLQAQAEAAATAGSSLDEEGGSFELVSSVLAAAADSEQLRSDTATAAATALATKVATEAARADQAAAQAAAAAQEEAQLQLAALASLQQQLESVQLGQAEAPAQPARAPAPARQAAQGWDPLSILLAPAAPLMVALAGARGHEAGAAPPPRNKYDMLLDVLGAAAAAPDAQVGGKRGATNNRAWRHGAGRCRCTCCTPWSSSRRP